jgi:hypothetical protein
MCAGEKKCAPTMRPAAFVLAPTSEMSMVDVLVDRMASGRHAASRSAKIFCFRPTSSSAASMTCAPAGRGARSRVRDDAQRAN